MMITAKEANTKILFSKEQEYQAWLELFEGDFNEAVLTALENENTSTYVDIPNVWKSNFEKTLVKQGYENISTLYAGDFSTVTFTW